jgi:Permeases of the major facilitator superfamily
MSALPQQPIRREKQRFDHEGRMRRAMRVAIAEGVLASASDNFAGPYLSLYALALGATHAQIGLVNAVPALLTNVLQIPSAVLTDRIGRRKALTVIGGFGLRFTWLPIALIPLVVPQGWSAVLALIVFLVLRSAFGALAVPAWTSLMADMIPRRMRGAYFSNRNILINFAALGATLLSGLILRVFRDPLGYQVTFLAAALCGAAAAYVFRLFPDPDVDAARRANSPAKPPERKEAASSGQRVERKAPAEAGERSWLAALRREKSYTAYALTSALWNFGVTLPQPLFAVYFVESLGGSASFWGVVTAATFVTTILGQRYWGRLTDRIGTRNVLVASGVLAAMIPGFWFVAFRPEHALWINLASGLGWAGFNLAAFNLLLEVTPDRGRATFVAGYNALIGVANFAGPLLGGVAADIFGVRPIFFTSTLVRLLAWSLFAFRVKTAFDLPFVWRELWPLPKGAAKHLAVALVQAPVRLVRRVHTWRLERAIRKKAIERLVEQAARQSENSEEPGA